MTALLFPQARPLKISPNVSFIPLIKLRDTQNSKMVCELYSTYSNGWHWISSVVVNTGTVPCTIVDVFNHKDPFTEQEVAEYISGFTKEAIVYSGDDPMGSFQMVDTENDPFELLFLALRVIGETA